MKVVSSVTLRAPPHQPWDATDKNSSLSTCDAKCETIFSSCPCPLQSARKWPPNGPPQSARSPRHPNKRFKHPRIRNTLGSFAGFFEEKTLLPTISTISCAACLGPSGRNPVVGRRGALGVVSRSGTHGWSCSRHPRFELPPWHLQRNGSRCPAVRARLPRSPCPPAYPWSRSGNFSSCDNQGLQPYARGPGRAGRCVPPWAGTAPMPGPARGQGPRGGGGSWKRLQPRPRRPRR